MTPNYFTNVNCCYLPGLEDSAAVDSQGNIFVAGALSFGSAAAGPLAVYNVQQRLEFSVPGDYTDLKIDAADNFFALKSGRADLYLAGFRAGAKPYQSFSLPGVQDIAVVPYLLRYRRAP